MTPAIHQYTPYITLGDGISNSLFFIKKILTALGYASTIYADNIHPELVGLVHPRSTYCDDGNNILFLHHAVAQPNPQWISTLSDRLVMIYHNITPSHYFNEDTPHLKATRVGRRQLQGWQNLFAGIIADSRYNAQELEGLGYKNVQVIPLLIDFEKLEKIQADEEIIRRHEKNFNLLFVGRIVENKCQHDLIHALARLRDKNIHLFCVGGVSSPEYQKYLEQLVSGYHLDEQVHLTGRVTNEALWGYYASADLFVCLSDHEGFGIPLIEAAIAGVPIAAYDSSNIRHTLGNTGLLLSRKNSVDVADVWKKLISQPEWRYRLASSQKANLSRFSFETLKQQLEIFLGSLVSQKLSPKKISPRKIISQESKPTFKICIEGPFDSNYSLALVNRELAMALTKKGIEVELDSTEGHGDYLPDQQFLKNSPEICALWNGGVRQKKADLSIRNLFPPRVTGMKGKRKLLAPYGWEESVFPMEWVASFNRQLHLVATVSDYVTRTLKNNGLTVPTVTIGNGADHLKEVKPSALPFDFPKGYTLLHISSCFPRKGMELLLAAFPAAYDAKTQVTLIIKTFPNPHNRVREQLTEAGWIEQGGATHSKISVYKGKDHPNKKILLVEDEFTPGQLVSLYQKCNLLVAPSKGEGYGLPMAEAMLFDLPVLTTGYGGQVDFCTPETAWLIDYRFARAKTHLNLADSVWVEPDLADLIKKMGEIATLPLKKIRQKTDRAKQNILRAHTWEQVANRLQNAVKNLGGQNCPEPSLSIGWVTSWNTRCGIASYSKYLIDALGSDRVTILANRTCSLTQPDAPNVNRCWEMGGKDDLSQLEQRILLQKFRAMVIQFNFSFFDLPAFSTLLTAMKKQDIRCYIFFHSTADVEPPHEPKSLSTIKSALYLADRLFVHSVKDLNILKKIGLIDNVSLFPHGVNSSGQTVQQPCPGNKLIAAYGFLLPHKGIFELISAFEILKKTEPDLKLLLLNALYPDKISRKEQDRCRQKIASSQFAKDITMVNKYLPEKEILEKLSQAQLIVYPCQNTQESSSASVRMGLTAGRLVAVTPLAIFEDVRDAVYTLPGTTPEDMAGGIKTILNDTHGTKKITAGRHAWLASHDWKILGKRLGGIIKG